MRLGFLAALRVLRNYLVTHNQSRRRPGMQPAVVILLAGHWLANKMGDFGDTRFPWLQIESEDRFTVRSVPTAGGIPGSRSATITCAPSQVKY